MHRRVIALVALGLMAHATLAPTMWACTVAMAPDAALAGTSAGASGRSSADAGARHDGHGGASLPERTPADAPQDTPCDAPLDLDCRCALTSCTAVSHIAGTSTLAVAPTPCGPIALRGILAPASLITAPDPPPPKA